MSIQLAFLSRNLVCSFDFRSIAEQFFSWMDADSLLQQFFNHLKESVYFSALRGVGFSCFGGPWVGNLFSWRMQWECSNFQIFRPNFGVHFWGSILGPWKVTRKCSQKLVPKLAPKTWPKVSIFFKCVASFKSKKVANPVPTKILTPSKQKIYWFFEMVEDCWSKFAVPIQLKNCSGENQMNIPNFCSRMLVEHSNLKPKLSASLL